MSELKPGDVVRLKSGGPKMTVEDVVGIPPSARCSWFIQFGEGWQAQCEAFAPAALVLAEPGARAPAEAAVSPTGCLT